MKAKTDRQDAWQRRRINLFGGGFGIGPFTLWKTEECDTCENFRSDAKSAEKYYFGLKGFYLNDEESVNQFFENKITMLPNTRPASNSIRINHSNPESY
ncbi:hypothetical protein LZZ85_09705 [Terrimonas sp. NA20]|uniref:Uncharacterized protein n=1 Tax=Terrimonas ginsenosidimutans TaxID=2908004 RepID=A0ABS9KQF3_9BACT|nr:hypothetical protein [Terrimonas ginsenosidimutans]MCG2614557.1 hypothetical protein [Terrimonas ginsenosidimutans]